MTTTPVEANVVLTADNSQYDQAMDQSSRSTASLAKSIDTLGTKINNLAKSAGRKMLGITAADVALITGATAAWASYEKQMSLLMAQSAIVSRTQATQTKTMNDYTASVKNLRTEFGTTTAAAAELTQSISKLVGNTRQISDLATTFEKMSMATGESASGLASSVLNLQKVMGTPTRDTQKYADQLTYLAAKSNTSATALSDFTAQLAPMGRAMGMTQTQVTGFANMFTKAGQDGYTAGSAFAKVSQDILTSIQTGSPDLNKYANLLGVTAQHFKSMSGAEQLAGFLDRISELGPKAAMTLNRFGFDGIRMARAITGTVQASGGAMNAIREAQVGYRSDAVDKGSAQAENMFTVLAKIREEMKMTAESFATILGPGIVIVLEGIEKVAGAFNQLMQGPLGKFIQVAAAVLVPITAIGGAMALMAGTIMKAAAAFALFRNSAALGLREGFMGNSRIVAETNAAGMRTGAFVAAEGGVLGQRGRQIAAGGSWFQRGMYNAGQNIGGFGRYGINAFSRGEGAGPGVFSRGAGSVVRFGSQAFTSQFDQMRYANPADRSKFFGQYFPGRGPEVMGSYDVAEQAKSRARTAQAVYASNLGARAMGASGAEQDEREATSKKAMHAANQEAAAAERAARNTMLNAGAQVKAAEQTNVASKANMGVYASMRAEGANVARAFAGAAAGATRFAVSTAVSGVGKLAGGAMNMLGGPLGIGMMAAMIGPMLVPLLSKLGLGGGSQPFQYQDLSGGGSAYLRAGGITPPSTGMPGVGPSARTGAARPLNLAQATAVTKQSVAIATAPGYKPVDRNLAGMSAEQATAYLSTNYDLYKNNPDSMNKLKLDLINTYGQEGATSVLASLAAGSGAGTPGQFFRAAQGGDESTNLNLAGGIRSQQIARAGAAQGATGRFRAIAGGIGTDLRRALQGGRIGGDALTELNRTYGLSVSSDAFRGIQQQAGLNLPQGVSANQNQQAYLSQLTSGSSASQLQHLIEALPEDQANAVKAKMGIGASVSGTALNQALSTTMTAIGKAPNTTTATTMGRIGRQGAAGQLFTQSDDVSKALGFGSQNIAANVTATNTMMNSLRALGQSAPQITKAMEKIKSTVGDPSDPSYILADWISGQAQRELSLKMPTMTRAQQFQSSVDEFQAISSVKPVTDQQWADRQKAEDDIASSMADQENYFKQLLIMQDQYDISRKRAQEDYATSRSYSEYDYQLGRSRAEEAYTRQRSRSIEDYYRGVNRAQFEFNLNRQRQEADFDHQVQVMAEQQAQSMYNLYQRTQVQRTSSAEWILSNAGDELTKMRQQESDLNKVRKMGLGDAAIQQLGLTDPANQQQLARFVTELTPKMISEFNKTAGTERVKAAKNLVTDQSSLEWQEMRRGYNLQRSRAEDDMERQMRQSQADFHRGLDRMATDFGISMDQQAADYQTQMDRQEHQYALTMKRAAEDLANVGKEIDMSFQQVLVQSTNKLTGHAQDQAAAVLQSYKDLKKNVEPEAVGLMQSLSNIFGFTYQVPKGVSGSYDPSNSGDTPHRMGGPVSGSFTGGVIPGWNPGRDTHTIAVGGGEGVLRPEATRAIGGEKVIDAINHAAIHGAFSAGGVFRPINEPVSRGLHDQYTGYSAVDLAAPVGTPVYAVSGGRITRSYDIPGPLPTDQYHNAQYGPFGSYGRVMYLKTDLGPEVLYAHLSRRGLAAGATVKGGQSIALSGSAGNSSGPHLHFGDSDGNPYEFILNALSGHGNSFPRGSGPVGTTSTSALLKALYPKSERAAKQMQGVHPLLPGDISDVINRFARRTIAQLGVAGYGVGAGIGARPGGNLDNQAIIRTAMRRSGWAGEWPSMYQLMMSESGFNNTAQNPTSTAYGMFQFLDSTWPTVGGHKTSDPWLQAKYGMEYIKERYNDPAQAWAFHRSHGWYGNGSVFTGAQTIGVGESGPEAVIPLNQRGGEFLGNVMARSVGLGSTPVRSGGVSMYKTQIDHSTNFTGPITVQATDPADLIAKLAARAKVMALSRPALTGSAA